jgi:hypothetical protein
MLRCKLRCDGLGCAAHVMKRQCAAAACDLTGVDERRLIDVGHGLDVR